MRYNPTRRGAIVLDRCLCGWDRKRKCWVANGCKVHPGRGRKAHGRIDQKAAADSDVTSSK